jgi:hypothetical protein
MSIAQDLTYPSVTELRYKDLRFLITDSPDDESVQSFTEVYNEFFSIMILIFFAAIGLFKIRCYSSSSSIGKNL